MQQEMEKCAIDVALTYALEMNKWEAAFEQEWSAHQDTYVHGAPQDELARYRNQDQAIQLRHRERYRMIFERYATEKERKYGGPNGPLSAGFPTKFSGISSSTSVMAEQKNTNRIEVTFSGLNSVNAGSSRFILLRVGGEWRIDSFKYRFQGEDKWNNGIL